MRAIGYKGFSDWYCGSYRAKIHDRFIFYNTDGVKLTIITTVTHFCIDNTICGTL